MISKMYKDTPVKFPNNISPSISLTYRNMVSLYTIKCDKNLGAAHKIEYFDSSNNMVYLTTLDTSNENDWVHLENMDKTPLGLLKRILCGEKEVQQ